MSFHEHKLALTEAMYKKLRNGHVVQAKPEHLQIGDKCFHVTKKQHTRIERAKRLAKGLRLRLDPQEIEASGGKLTFKKVGKALMHGLRAVNRTGALKPLISLGLTALGANPVMSAVGTQAVTGLIGKGRPSVVQQADKPALARRINSAELSLDQRKEGQGLFMSTNNPAGKGLMMSTSAGHGLMMVSGRGKNQKRVIL